MVYDKLDALDRLIASVVDNLTHSYAGSIDAAKNLHDSLLGQSDWASVSFNGRNEAMSEVTTSSGTWQAASCSPARALMIATLKAYRQNVAEGVT